MRPTIYAVFEDSSQAEKALGALLDRGAVKEDIVAILPAERLDPKSGKPAAEQATSGITTTTGADAASGAGKGAGAGLAVGAVAAIASLAIPGFGIVTGGSALATALAGVLGATAGGALAGGVAGFLQDQGVPERIALDADAALKNGQGIISLQYPSGRLGEFEMREIFSKYGANSYWRHGHETPVQ